MLNKIPLLEEANSLLRQNNVDFDNDTILVLDTRNGLTKSLDWFKANTKTNIPVELEICVAGKGYLSQHLNKSTGKIFWLWNKVLLCYW